MPDTDLSNDDNVDRISDSESNLRLVFMRLLGDGLSAELIAEAIAAHYKIFSCTNHMRDLPPCERVARILERFKSAENDFGSALQTAIAADLTGNTEAPRFNWKTKRVYDGFAFIAPLVAATNNITFLKTYATVIRDAAIAIKRATDVIPVLDQASADWWVERRSWTIGEFAALSLERKPIAGAKQLPVVPPESSIAEIFREFRERCDQLSRAAKIRTGSEKLPHTSITPLEARTWAALNDFPFPTLLVPRPPTVYPKADLSAFRDTVVKIAAQEKLRLKKEAVHELFSKTFPRARADAFESDIWPAISTGTGGRFSDDYEERWKSVRKAVEAALPQWKR